MRGGKHATGSCKMRFVRSTRRARRLRREAGARLVRPRRPTRRVCRGRATRIQAGGSRVDGSATRSPVVASAHPLACCGPANELAKCGYRTRAAACCRRGRALREFISSTLVVTGTVFFAKTSPSHSRLGTDTLAPQKAQQTTAPYGPSKRPTYSSGRPPFPTLPWLRLLILAARSAHPAPRRRTLPTACLAGLPPAAAALPPLRRPRL